MTASERGVNVRFDSHMRTKGLRLSEGMGTGRFDPVTTVTVVVSNRHERYPLRGQKRLSAASSSVTAPARPH